MSFLDGGNGVTLNKNASNNLQYLFRVEKALFSEEIIDIIIKLGKKSKYNIYDMSSFSTLLMMPEIQTYTDLNDQTMLLKHNNIFDDYFKYICEGKKDDKGFKLNYLNIKNHILSLLRCKIVIPNRPELFNISSVKVDIKTDYRDLKTYEFKNPFDVQSLFDKQFVKAYNNCQHEVFNYKNDNIIFSNLPEIPFQNIIRDTVLLQEMIKQYTDMLGVASEPFLKMYKLNKKLTEKVERNDDDDDDDDDDYNNESEDNSILKINKNKKFKKDKLHSNRF